MGNILYNYNSENVICWINGHKWNVHRPTGKGFVHLLTFIIHTCKPFLLAVQLFVHIFWGGREMFVFDLSYGFCIEVFVIVI